MPSEPVFVRKGGCMEDRKEALVLGTEIDKWLRQYKETTIKPGSYDRFRASYRQLCADSLSNAYLNVLSADDIQQYITRLVKKGYALSTIKLQYTLIRAYLRYAFLKGLIPTPFYEGVRLPNQNTIRKPARDVRAYTVLEQAVLVKELKRLDSPADMACLLMLEEGLRSGEVMALKWDDIDFDKGTIHIHKTVVRLSCTNEVYVQDEAKSRTSNRTIPLSTVASEALAEYAVKFGKKCDYVFADGHSESSPIKYWALRECLRRRCRAAGIPFTGTHILRHTFATNCYRRGCDVKVLSKMLGHANVNITYNIYIHLYGDGLEEMRAFIK